MTIYVCDDSDAQGYYGADTSLASFSIVQEEYGAVQYSEIDGDDNEFVGILTGNDGRYGFHKYVFTIDENVNNIGKINITFKGYATMDDGEGASETEVGLYVKENGTYTQKDVHTYSSKGTFSHSITSNFSDFVDGSNDMYIGATHTNPVPSGTGTQSIIYAYYVEVEVISYIDSGIRYYTGTKYIKIAEDNNSNSDSDLYYYDGSRYIRIALVDPEDSTASCMYYYNGNKYKCVAEYTG